MSKTSNQSADSAGDQGGCYAPQMLSVEQALSYVLQRARPIDDAETVPLAQSLGRVLSETQFSSIDVPGYDNSSMDGYAVRSADATGEATTRLRVTQRVAAGDMGSPLNPGEAARIFTGAPIPPGADAVVMQEICGRSGDFVSFAGPVAAGQHVRPRGNNIAAGAEVLVRGTRMRPQEMGLAAALGLADLPLFRRLRVAVLSSGDELLQPGEPMCEGKIYNSNRFTLLGLLAGLGMQALDHGIVPDDLERTREALRSAASKADVIVTTGGVSVGDEDHVRRAIESIGRVEMWQVAVKPGKPLTYGHIDDVDFLGLPGNPVSTLVTFCLFVRPFLLRRQGVADVHARAVRVRADFRWPKAMGRREYVRARLVPDRAGGNKARVYPKQGSDVLSSAVWAHGLVEIPEQSTIAPGDEVSYYSFADLLA